MIIIFYAKPLLRERETLYEISFNEKRFKQRQISMQEITKTSHFRISKNNSKKFSVKRNKRKT